MNRSVPLLLSLCLLAPAAGATDAAEKPAPDAEIHTAHMLNLALVIAEKEPGQAAGELAPAVAKAIADVKEFLPFKHYKLADSALIRTTSQSSGHVELTGWGRSYYADFYFQGGDGGKRLEFRKFELMRRASDPRTRDAKGQPADPAPRDRTIISTSFSIAPGETILVGTSTIVDQSLGLIVVLTALPQQ